MFLAIIFVCLNAGDCAFIAAPIVRTEAMCELILKERMNMLEKKKDAILLASASCLQVTKSKGDI